ncbi:MAG: class II aldolase/adducin family protein [Promethearchaeota archaeon]|nr:MAG: class II aldolase/adducin family protein [Candidatus Lokiarchaeota archaeon]
MASNKEEKFRMDVVEGAQALHKKGLVEDGEGNVSVRLKKDEILITPSSNPYMSLTPDSIVHINLEGEPIGIKKIPSTESKMHLAVYKARSKVKSVIHTHSPYVTMLSVLRKDIPVIMEQQIIFLGGEIKVSSIGEAHTEEMGVNALEALGRNNGALLANHGAIVCGKSIEHAVRFAIILEKLAKIYWGVLQIGEPEPIPEEKNVEHVKMFESFFATYPRTKG